MRFLILLGAVIAVFTGYVYYWNSLSDGLLAAAEQWIEDRRGEGFDIAHEGMEVRGFPYRLALEIDRLSIARPDSPLQWRVATDWLTIHWQPWNLAHAVAVFEGEQKISFLQDGRRRSVTVAAKSARASAKVTDRTRFANGALDLQIGTLKSDDGREYAFKRIQFHLRANRGEDEQRPDGTVDAALLMDDVTLPPDETIWRPARRIERARIALRLEPPLPRSLDPAALSFWRDQGGVIAITGIDGKWGALAVTGDGSLTLDERNRPLASLSLKMRGVDALAADLRRRSEPNLRRIGELLAPLSGLLAREDGQGRYVKAPVTVQDGVLSVGPLPILAVPPLF